MKNQEYKKMVLRLDAGFAGTDSAEFWLVPIGITETELENTAWERAIDHASMYGIYPESDRPDEDDYSDDYTDNISGFFEEYDPDRHDGLRVGNDESWQEW